MYFTKSFIIIITISVELFILDFTHIVTIDIYHILICSFSMSSLPRRKLRKVRISRSFLPKLTR
ncbi:hypothetical protein C2U42_14555 [Klebsiella oxytoca]|nr:hypothetical protein C2U42_14555 [Klebsiella oxytoca]